MSKKAKAGPLRPYRGKRRFEKTPEPEGTLAAVLIPLLVWPVFVRVALRRR